MKSKTSTAALPARDRILQVATDLFYTQGYRATGINEVIQKSGVAKATFYNHFPSKDDLGIEYLRCTMEKELNKLKQLIQATDGAQARFELAILWLKEWLKDTKYRGCPFLHIVAEIPETNSPMRIYGKKLYDEIRTMVKELSEELIASDPKRYGKLDAENLTSDYLVAFTGAIALAEIYNKDWPVDHALQTVRRLIGE